MYKVIKPHARHSGLDPESSDFKGNGTGYRLEFIPYSIRGRYDRSCGFYNIVLSIFLVSMSFRFGRNLSDVFSEGFPTRFTCPLTGGFAEENGNDNQVSRMLYGRILSNHAIFC